MKSVSLITRAVRMAALRIGAVAALAGVVSYKVNHDLIEQSTRRQLLLSTSERLKREAIPFKEIQELQRMFLAEFREIYSDPERRAALAKDFERYFIRRPDAHFYEAPHERYAGTQFLNGQSFKSISAVLFDKEPSDDVKARFTLNYILTHKFSSTNRGLGFVFYAILPERGTTIYWPGEDLAAKCATLGLRSDVYDSFDFYRLGKAARSSAPIYTDIYQSPTAPDVWSMTVLTADEPLADGRHLTWVCIGLTLDELMERTANPGMTGSWAAIFRADDHGTLLYHPQFNDAIRDSGGKASVESLRLESLYPALRAVRSAPPGEAIFVDSEKEIVAAGIIPNTPWAMVVLYPKALMQPAILQNLAVVAVVGVLALVVELLILRFIIKNQVGQPLVQLTAATRMLGSGEGPINASSLPTGAQSEIGDLARDFAAMAMRIQEAHDTLEAKVEQRTKEAASAQAEAVAANNAKSMFLANMSHEIRTPMNAILGFAQLMQSDPSLPKDQLARVEPINRAGEHLLHLINDILEMSKIEAGRITRNDSAFDLHALLDELLQIYQLRAESRGIALKLERSESVPRHIISDEAKVRQILVNLLGNALKFTKVGSVRLVASASEVAGSARLLTFSVIDTGPGITAEAMGKLFQPFVQADEGIKSGGTGLGLAISRRYAQLLDGDVTVSSKVGRGAAFTFTAIVALAGPEEVIIESELPSVQHLQEGQSARILIVDDVDLNCQLLAEMLNPVGFVTRITVNGMEAVERFQDWHPDAILMDIHMPVMDGFEAMRRIRELESGGSVFIVGLTASAFEADKEKVLAAGADVFLRKPFKRNDLLAVIGERLHLRYEYAEPLQPAASAAPSLPIPKTFQADIRKACSEADYSRLMALADDIAAGGNVAAADAIRERSANFAYEGILDLLKEDQGATIEAERDSRTSSSAFDEANETRIGTEGATVRETPSRPWP